MKKPPSKRLGSSTKGNRRTAKSSAADVNSVTTDEFEREDMGIAPKE